MASEKFISSRNLFHVICLITTIIFVAWCFNEYFLDHDYSETRFAGFHETSEDIHPSLTICNSDPYDYQIFHNSTKNSKAVEKPAQKGPLTTAHGQMGSFLQHYYSLYIDGNKQALEHSQISKASFHRLFNTTYEETLEMLRQIDYDELTVDLTSVLSEVHMTIPILFNRIAYLHYHARNGSLIANHTDIKNLEEQVAEKYWGLQSNSLEFI